MARSSTSFKPGQSGNPNGRPKKSRALTEILEKAGNATIEDADGKRRGGKRIVARLVWEGISTGEVSFPGGKRLKLSPADWFDLLKWVYAQVDGPPKHLVDVTTNDESLNAGSANYTAEQQIRAITTLYDAIRAGMLDGDSGGQDAMDATERPAVGGDPESSG
jgi:hypothetical protein